MDIAEYLTSRKKMVDKALDRCVPDESTYPREIHRAMRYSLFPGGKRFRAILVIASSEAVGGKPRQVLPSACAMELIHTYSLIHDDLPAIDNDDYRRGKLSTHRKFGEAVAILAGDALLSRAFSLLAQNCTKPEASDRRMFEIVQEVSEAIGSLGMIGGQVVDIRKKKRYTREEIKYIHTHKTGALIKVSVRVGAILAGAKLAELRNLSEYGENIGLAFQIMDDILDASCEEEGPNYTAIFGEDASREKILSGMADYMASSIDRDSSLRSE
jgi:geranylgeranyl diphosphate synthase type II